MNEKTYITQRDLDLIVENLSLKLSACMSEKFDEFAETLHQSNIDRRNSTVHEVTGFEWHERSKIKKSVQHSYKASIDAKETKSHIKKVFIGYSLPFGIGAFLVWLAEHWNKLTGN